MNIQRAAALVSRPPAGAERAVSAGATPGGNGDEVRLRQVSRQMEGVFVQELFKAMRETIPQGEGVVDGGMGEEIFSGLMDQHLASQVGAGGERGLGAAIYRQLRKLLPDTEGVAPPPDAANRAD
jgi:flagellar protein FlgJ